MTSTWVGRKGRDVAYRKGESFTDEITYVLRRNACPRCVVNLADMRPGGLFSLVRRRPIAKPGRPAPPTEQPDGDGGMGGRGEGAADAQRKCSLTVDMLLLF